MIQEVPVPEWEDVYEPHGVVEDDGLDIWGIAFRRKWTILLGVIVGGTLAALLYARSEPVYESSAQMLIRQKVNALPVQVDSPQQMQVSAARIDHSLVLASPMIVNQAVQTKSLDRLPSLATSGDPVSAVRSGLSVTPTKNSANVVSLRFRGPDPNDCPQVLDALVDTYREFLITSETNVSQEAIDVITEAEQAMNQTLKQQERDHQEFRESVRQSAPDLWTEGEEDNVFQERRTQIEDKILEVTLRNSELSAKIKALQDSVKRGVNPAVLMILAGDTSQGLGDGPKSLLAGELASPPMQDQLLTLLVELDTLSRRYGRRHPKITALKRKIETIKRLQREFLAEEPLLPEQEEPEDDFAQIYLTALEEQLAVGEQELSELQRQSQEHKDDAELLGAFLAKDREHQGRIQQTRAYVDVLMKRLQEINLIEDAIGGDRYTVQELSSAGRGSKVAPSLTRFAFSGVALGLLGGFGLAYLMDRADQTFRHPEEVSQLLGVPLIGQIPEMRRADQKLQPGSPLDPVLVTAHRPKSSLAEAYRAVRTALYFSTRSKQHQVLQVTSPLPGDGKSTLAANLAITFAQSGKRVLLLDADFRRPVVHKRFGLRSDVGLASVVDGQAEPPQAIQETCVHNLWAMTCGPRPDNPSELLTSPRFEELLCLVRDQYDFVLVDTPPLLAVTDPSVVAARVDGVLLTMRLQDRARGLAVQAYRMLRELDVRLVGVVVNGVSDGTGSYKYGRRRYGYGYGYGSYGDSSPRAAISSYYEEPEPTGNGKDETNKGARGEGLGARG